jgi:nucleotide-binding universal stress UspA family protein
MHGHDQLEIERPARSRVSAQPIAGPKTILVHLEDNGSVDVRLETALSLARASSAHVQCLHVTPMEAYVALDSFGTVFVMDDVLKAIGEEEKVLEAAVSEKLRHEDVSWDYVQVTGDIANQVVKHAALADLVVTGREPARTDHVGPALSFVGGLLRRLRTPLFIPAAGRPPADPTAAAVIAWDGNYEAANAVRGALPLLKLGSAVHVVQVTEGKDEVFPSTTLLEYLSRHGIHAEMTVERCDGKRPTHDFVSAALMGRAQAVNAAYVVMGGYSHSRVGEYLFGGVTRTMLSASAVPILISH